MSAFIPFKNEPSSVASSSSSSSAASSTLSEYGTNIDSLLAGLQQLQESQESQESQASQESQESQESQASQALRNTIINDLVSISSSLAPADNICISASIISSVASESIGSHQTVANESIGSHQTAATFLSVLLADNVPSSAAAAAAPADSFDSQTSHNSDSQNSSSNISVMTVDSHDEHATTLVARAIASTFLKTAESTNSMISLIKQFITPKMQGYSVAISCFLQWLEPYVQLGIDTTQIGIADSADAFIHLSKIFKKYGRSQIERYFPEPLILTPVGLLDETDVIRIELHEKHEYLVNQVRGILAAQIRAHLDSNANYFNNDNDDDATRDAIMERTFAGRLTAFTTTLFTFAYRRFIIQLHDIAIAQQIHAETECNMRSDGTNMIITGTSEAIAKARILLAKKFAGFLISFFNKFGQAIFGLAYTEIDPTLGEVMLMSRLNEMESYIPGIIDYIRRTILFMETENERAITDHKRVHEGEITVALPSIISIDKAILTGAGGGIQNNTSQSVVASSSSLPPPFEAIVKLPSSSDIRVITTIDSLDAVASTESDIHPNKTQRKGGKRRTMKRINSKTMKQRLRQRQRKSNKRTGTIKRRKTRK